jgi:outer membrane protein
VKKFAVGLLTTLSLTSLNAGLIDVEAGAGVWLVDSTGEVVYKGDPLDFEDDLGIDGTLASYGYIDISHFIPVIPNVKIDITQFGEEANKNIPNGVQKKFAEEDLTGQLKSNLNLNQIDIIAYYNLIGTILHADVGFGVKYYVGSIDVDSKDQNESGQIEVINNDTIDVDFPIPIVYARVGADIPGTNIGAYVDLKYMKFSPSVNLELVDMSAKVRATPFDLLMFKMNVELGYRVHRLQVYAEDNSYSGFNADIKNEVSGFFGGINIEF